MSYHLPTLAIGALLAASCPFVAAAPDAPAPVEGRPVSRSPQDQAKSPFDGVRAARHIPPPQGAVAGEHPALPAAAVPLSGTNAEAQRIALRQTDCAHVGTADGKAIYRIRGEYVFDTSGASLCEALKPLLASTATNALTINPGAAAPAATPARPPAPVATNNPAAALAPPPPPAKAASK